MSLGDDIGAAHTGLTLIEKLNRFLSNHDSISLDLKIV